MKKESEKFQFNAIIAKGDVWVQEARVRIEVYRFASGFSTTVSYSIF